MRNKMVAWVLSVLLVLGLLGSLVSVGFAAPSIKSDSAFFAKMNLDLAGLESVKTVVDSGYYTSAKTALLKYYKGKFADLQTYTGGVASFFTTMAMRDTFAYLETPLASTTVTYKDSSFAEYSFGKVSNTSGCYVLSALKKTSYSAELCSGEYGTASMRPVLKCYNSAGTLLSTVEPSADATVKYGNKSTNYATATTLFARHDATSTLPYSTNSQRAYLKFTVPSGTAKTELVIYARINGGSSSSHSLELWQFSARGTGWTESNLTWDWLVSNNAIGHYSYNGVTGGFDWKAGLGTPPNDWIDMHCRLHCVYALFQSALGTSSATDRATYLNKGKSYLFDFINDADVTAGWPDGRDKETPYRLNYAPFFYKTLLENDLLTSDENVTFLKWIYDELEFLNGGGNLFDNSGTNHKSSAYTNHSFHHISGLYTGLSYFSEFKSASTWKSTYNNRWKSLINDIGLLGTDGSYNEGLLGAYTQEVMSCMSQIAMAMKESGDTTSAKSKEYMGYMISFMGFMTDMTFPNNSTPATGQRAATAPKTYIQDFLNCLSTEFYSERGVQELLYFLDHSQGIEPNTTAYYPVGQFASDRTGYTTSDSMLYMSARAAGHYDHPDALAILYYAGGRYLLAETATSTNTTAGHNTVECNGQTQRMNLKPMTYKDSSGLDAVGNKAFSTMSAWTEITEGFRHERDVSYFKALNGLIVVTDKAQKGDGTSTTQYSYVQNWHSASDSNASVASDSYDTGKTAFSSGTNLIIAQTSSNSITAAVSGNNFKYTQKAAGAVTYQTVLYPAKAGATVSIQPKKLSLNVGDSVARAVQIAVSDTANPDLKNLYFYQSLESKPSSRAFGSYTTNASGGAVALNASSKRIFASLTNGSSLTVTSSSLPVLKTNATVTDLGASLQGTTLALESSDKNITARSIRVNLDGATVTKVTLNGEEQSFYTDAQGTVYVGRQIIHFNGDAMGTVSKWTVNLVTLTADTANSVINGVTTGDDPYLYYNGGDMNYDIRSGDIVEIRLKTTLGTTTAPTTQIFYETTDGSGFGANGAVNGTRPAGYTDGEFTVVRFALPAKSVGKTIKKLRIDPFPGNKGKSFSLDYVYVGSADKAPSSYEGSLLFDFTNDPEAELRYTAQSYGDRSFDTNTYSTAALSTGGVWYLNGNQSSGIAVSGGAMAVTQKASTDWGYISTADCLKYYTNSGDIIQVRLKLLNMEVVAGTSPKLQFYANNSSADLYNTTPVTIPCPGSMVQDRYYVLQAPLTASMISADYLTSARLQWTNFRNIEGQSGKFVIDYIYIGPASKAPGAKDSYEIRYNDGFNLFTAFDGDISASIVNGGDKVSTYSVKDRKLIIQNKRASGETYHFFSGAGEEFYLTAGKEYRFSCTTSGLWGSQVEAFLRTGSTYIHMDSNNFTFTPTVTGAYQLRFDVNGGGQTHSFENVRIEEASNPVTTYGLTAPSTHFFGEAKVLSTNGFSRPGYIFKGWSTAKGATAVTYTDGQSVSNLSNVPTDSVTLYAVWEKNPYPSTWLYQLPCRTLDGTSYRQNMSYVIKTRGGKIIVIDGGYETENGDAEYLLSFLRELTGKTVPNVDAWFFTHPHEDHLGAFEGLAKRHGTEITVDTVYYNFPSQAQLTKYAPTSVGNSVANVISIFEGLIKNLKRADGTPVKVVEILSRQQNKCKGSFTIDTVSFDVLMTCEDMFAAADSNTTLYTGTLATNGKAYSNKTVKELLYDDFGNNISCVLRMTVGGKNVLFLGDLAEPGGIVLRSYHDANSANGNNYFSLKSDMVQMAHHGQTGVPKTVYEAIDPDICLWPTPDWVYTAGSTSTLSTYYTRRWIAELGAENYVSADGPQVFEFPDARSGVAVSIPEDLKPLVFDATYYANKYGDVKNAYGTDASKLYTHFINNGIAEGRSGSPYFDIQYYIYQNSQALLDECKGDYVKGFAHFVKYVYDKNEFASGGKKLSPIFDCKYYKQNYTDIAAMSTEFEALKHFVNTGYAAGRVASEEMITLDNRVYHSAKTVSAVSATCTASGTTAGKVCSLCGEVLSGRTATSALGHSYTYKATKNPTTSATGVLTGTCSRCDHTTTVTLPKLNTTDYTKTTTKAPTCTATGTDSYKWKTTTYGTFSFTATTAAKGHTSVADPAVAATCTTAGKTAGSHCSVCNTVLTAQTTVAALGHSYDSGKISTYPTLTAQGVMTYTCERSGCGASYTKALEKLRGELFFDFSNTTADQSRYANATYNFFNFDDPKNVRWRPGKQFESLTIDNTKGEMTLKATDVTGTSFYLDSSESQTVFGQSLHFDAGESTVYQIRFKMTDFAPSGTPYVNLQFWSDGAIGSDNRGVNVRIPEVYLSSGEYIVLTSVIPEALRSNGNIQSVRVLFGSLTNAEGKYGTLTVDYIYVGTEEGLPTPRHTVTFRNADGTVLQSSLVHHGESAVYTGKTPTKSYDGSYHYSFSGWDKTFANVTSDLTVTAKYSSAAHSYTYSNKNTDRHTANCTCGYSKDLSHTWNTGTVTTKPTCTVAGVKTFTCSVCKGTKTEAVAATGHTSVTDPAVAPTCTATGLTEGAHCSVCNAVLTAQTTVEALGHNYNNVVTAPTCTAQGYTTHTCSRCSDTYKDTYVAATGHSYTYKASKNPTTSATGTLTGTCSK